MTTLSGRVDLIEEKITFLIQDLLLKIDQNSASTQATNWNQQFDIVDSNITTMKNQLMTLQSLYTNLYINVQNNMTAFRTHTGQLLTGSNPAHSGSP